MKIKSCIVKRNDDLRVLLTETSPYEVPVIFSNIGFYNNIHFHRNRINLGRNILDYLFSKNVNEDFTIPLNYKIKKDIESSRILSLIHPRSQIAIAEFYKQFSSLVISSCKKSDFSIRAPSRIASKYFLKNRSMLDKEFLNDEAQNDSDEKKYKHLSSYFSYNRYTRLHGFFNSKEFLKLERNYEIFCSIDVAKCFDSIYTHSITWSVKNKEYSKANRQIKNSFGSLFDRLMQSINYNETAGIIIGPEVSRVFSEIIFQEIDREIEIKLKSLSYENEQHYTIRRYVDDIFVFTLNENILSDVRTIISDVIKEYKMSINKQKVFIYRRPFSTAKTSTIIELNEILTSLASKFIDHENPKHLKKIFSVRKTVISYLGKIKAMFANDRQNYSLVSGYTISALTNIAIDIDRNIKESENYYVENDKAIADFFMVSIELILHLFLISPSHASSTKICIIIDIVCGIYIDERESSGEVIKGLIYNLVHSYFERLCIQKESERIINLELEHLNLLIGLKSLGVDYKLNKNLIEKIFAFKKRDLFSYFEIITLLYYIGNDQDYNALKNKIISSVNKVLDNLSDIKIDSLKCYLFLDYINCPFVEKEKREHVLKKLLKTYLQRVPTAQEIGEGWRELTQMYWFVQWDNINLRSFLEKKELLKTY